MTDSRESGRIPVGPAVLGEFSAATPDTRVELDGTTYRRPGRAREVWAHVEQFGEIAQTWAVQWLDDSGEWGYEVVADVRWLTAAGSFTIGGTVEPRAVIVAWPARVWIGDIIGFPGHRRAVITQAVIESIPPEVFALAPGWLTGGRRQA